MYALKLFNDHDLSIGEVERIFRQFGKVISVLVDKDRVIFVKYETFKEAVAALRGVSGRFTNLGPDLTRYCDEYKQAPPTSDASCSRAVQNKVMEEMPPLVAESEGLYTCGRILVLSNLPKNCSREEITELVGKLCGFYPISVSRIDQTEECELLYCYLEFRNRNDMLKCQMYLNSNIYKNNTLMAIEPSEAINAYKFSIP